MAKPMNSWNDFKKTLRELNDPAVKERFQTVVLDTADIMYGYCEDYICSQMSDMDHQYDSIPDIPYGKGYKTAQAEFDEGIRRILQMDYGLVLISHSVDKTFKDENGVEYSQIIPTLDTRARLVCERTCDIIGYSRPVTKDDGTSCTKLFLRGTNRYVAGSRFHYTPDYIDFTYENLVQAIADAVDKEAQQTNLVTDKRDNEIHAEPTYDFPAMMAEVQALIGKLMATGSMVNAQKITKIVDEHLGAGKKVSDCTPTQAPQVDMILFDLRRLV